MSAASRKSRSTAAPIEAGVPPQVGLGYHPRLVAPTGKVNSRASRVGSFASKGLSRWSALISDVVVVDLGVGSGLVQDGTPVPSHSCWFCGLLPGVLDTVVGPNVELLVSDPRVLERLYVAQHRGWMVPLVPVDFVVPDSRSPCFSQRSLPCSISSGNDASSPGKGDAMLDEMGVSSKIMSPVPDPKAASATEVGPLRVTA